MKEQEKEVIEANIKFKSNFILDTQIENCNYNDLFLMFQNYFISLFRDIQELRKFILFLKKDKQKETVNNIMQNFKKYLNEFRIK